MKLKTNKISNLYPHNVLVAIFILTFQSAYCESSPVSQSFHNKEAQHEKKEVHVVSNEIKLEHLLEEGDRQAIELCNQMNQNAWPIISKGASMQKFRSRQISMICAGSLGGEPAVNILITGLADKHINVRLAAAGELSKNPPANSQQALLNEIKQCSNDAICESLVLGIGRIPNDASIEALLELAKENEDMTDSTQLALAKLNHPPARKKLLAKFESKEAYIRYEALSELVYINDPKLASFAKKLTTDIVPTVTIGTPYDEQHRRVCDQAVDTLVTLLKLKPSFQISPETIYSVTQLTEINKLTAQVSTDNN